METYNKINTLYKRDPNNKNRLIIGDYSQKEVEYLKDLLWGWTEKIDGCLHYSTLINTDNGKIPVGRIVNEKLPVKILSYDVINQKIEYQDIINYHKEVKIRDFLCVKIKGRKSSMSKQIVCTDNHKFFTNNEWVEAKHLKPGMFVNHYSDVISEEIKQIILGMLLGDASIYRPSKTTRGVSITHSIKQSEYFDFIKMLLGNVINETKGNKGGFEGSSENRRANSIITPSISDLIINMCEVDNKKHITQNWVDNLSPMGIAFWYMDDGSISLKENQRPRARFATNGFSFDEVELLKNMLKIKFNIDSKIFDYKGATLCLTADSTEKLFSIIFPYICDSMKYKLSPNYKNFKCSLNNTLDMNIGLLEAEIISIDKNYPKRASGEAKYQYDLTINKNSNYFASDILVHNTNIKVGWDGYMVKFEGKTKNADIPKHLLKKLESLFPIDKMKEVFPLEYDEITNEELPMNIILYGEGYGAKIQKGGNYIPNDVNFRLIDIKIGKWWLTRNSCEEIAEQLNIDITPFIGYMTISEAEEYVIKGFKSTIAENKDYNAEGLVGKPLFDLVDRSGKRIIVKIKTVDYRNLGM